MAIDVPTPVKITCSREDLGRALQVVSRAVSTRTSVQILGGILLETLEEELRLSATDMEMSIRVGLPVPSTVETGSVVVPGRLLTDIVRLLPAGEVSMSHETREGVFEISCGPALYRLQTYRADDFPRLPTVEAERLVSVPRDALIETVARVSRAASRDESRPVLTGILLQLARDRIVMAATDSYRLSVKETSLGRDIGEELEAIVPARALSEVVRIAQAGTSDDVQVGVQENQVVFGSDGVWLTARRIDGQFPNYRQLRPDTFEAEIRLSREEVLDTVRRVALMAQRNAPLRLRFEEGELTIQAQSQDIGEARESLPIAYSGDPLEIGFNPDFLREGFESIAGPEVRLQLISPLRPGLITAEGDDFWYLIMPIRLAG